ncbi:uncharacterized protein NEMAJ01_1166 [Nematocida major]|uniref:uncharacterized protein n=1 Tax=Nematocida major TaxID=1912982 RepID=UPI0020086059|nr:uncharacterized protein NEMAJ01_1166 [Nematocida major]KAH9386270.1 hypothetical protein NEMAJ01_1166 [Nematocida major]
MDQLAQLHHHLEHPGIEKTYYTIKDWIKVPNLKEVLKKVQKACNECQRYKKQPTTSKGKPLGVLATTEPFEHICTDIVGPYNTYLNKRREESKKLFVISITDRWIRWTKLKVIRKISSRTVVQALREWIEEHGVPKAILHDQGRQYVSTITQTFLQQHEINSIKTTPFNPTGNGISERLNKEITFVLAVNQELTQREAARRAMLRLNYTYHKGLRCTPYELVYNSHPIDKDQQITPHHEVMNKIKQRNAKSLHLENSILRPDQLVKLSPGNPVYHKVPNPQGKLSVQWRGPFLIHDCDLTKGILTYRQGNKLVQTNLHQVRAP